MRSPIPPDFATIVSSGIFGPFQPLGGFHEIEEDELGYFVWTRKRFGVRKTLGLRCLEINLCYYLPPEFLGIDDSAFMVRSLTAELKFDLSAVQTEALESGLWNPVKG